MYCSNCGNELKAGLNYCNRCGGKVARAVSGNDSVAKGLATSLGYIGLFGFLSLVAIVAILIGNEVDAPVIVVVTAMFLATLFGISFIILRQISKLSEKTTESNQTNTPSINVKELNSPITNQLEEPKHAPASVVEHTTRTLDKVPIKHE